MIFKRKCLFTIIVLSTISLSLFISCNKESFLNGLTELDKPKNLKVSDITSDKATVSWSAVENAYIYEVEWTAKNFEKMQSDWVMTNSIVLNDLYFDNQYTVSVRAQSNPNSKEYCDSDWVTCSFTTLPDVIPQDGFARPVNVNAKYDSKKKILTVSWDAVEGAAFYDISIEYTTKKSYRPNTYKLVNTVSATQTSYTETNILGDEVWIKVAARNKDFSDSCRWSNDFYLKL